MGDKVIMMVYLRALWSRTTEERKVPRVDQEVWTDAGPSFAMAGMDRIDGWSNGTRSVGSVWW